MNALDRLGRESVLSRLSSDRLLRYNAIYLSGTLAAGAFGYVFHFVAGRMLGPAQYAVVASAVAALYILTLPALVVQTVSARFTSVAAGKANLGNVPGLIIRISALGLAVGLVIVIPLLAASGSLSAYLQISDRRLIVCLALSSLIALLLSTTRGALQGLRRFVALSVNAGLDMATRVVSAIVLVVAGLGSLGGAIALVIGPAAAYAESLFLFRGMRKAQVGEEASLAQVGRYAVMATVGAMGTTYLYNADVILSKHYLLASAAGIYAAASVLGRVVYFLGVTVAQVMFPEVAALHARNEPHYHVVDKSLGLMVVIASGLTLIYALVPALVVLPFGNAFRPVQPYLWPFAIALGLLAIVNILINYFLSIGSARFAIPLVAACALETGLIFLFHASAAQILGMVLATLSALSATLLGAYMFERLRNRASP